MKRMMMPLLLVVGLLGTLIVSAVVVPNTAAYAPVLSPTTPIIVTEPPTPTWDSAKPHVAELTMIYLPVVSGGTFLTPNPMPTATPGNAITYPTELPVPVVVEQSPARNEEINPDGNIEVVFDRAMDQASVESAFAMVASTDALNTADTAQANSQSVVGTFTWKNERTLVFKPATVLERGMTYTAMVGATAHASDGTPIGRQFVMHITTAEYLAVNQVVPAPQTDDIALDNVITVMFNHPVVPLQAFNNNNDMPQPLSFMPSIEGTGEWLNTSIYVFHPTVPLMTNTRYTAIIDPSLTDVTGNPMQSAYRWQFTTVPPTPVEVEYSVPRANATNVSLEPIIRVRFNQSVNRDAAIASMQLLDSKGSRIQGIATLVGNTLVFTPSQRLDYRTNYRISVQAGVTSAEDGSPMVQPYECPFTTVPIPHVITTSPTDGEQHVRPYSRFSIQFNAPVTINTIISHLEITPPISSTQVYSYFNAYNNTFYLVMNMQPATDYSVHILPGIADPYGSTTTEDMFIQFRTDELDPEASLVVPGTIATYSAHTPQRVLLRTVNVRAATLQLYQLPTNALLNNNFDYYGDTLPAGAQLMRHWQVPLDVPRNTETDTAVSLTEDASSLVPGIYMLALDQPSSSYHQYHVLVVSSRHLTLKASERDALVWANDGQTGMPTPNLPIAFYNRQGTLLGRATTDSDGIAQIAIARTTNDGLIVMTETDTGAPFAATSGTWSYGISPTSFNLLQDYNLPEMNIHLYTDRGIYRPGQTVAFKGIVRNEDDVQYSLPGALNATVKAYNEWNEQVYEEQMILNKYGTLSGEVALPDTARLGTYRITLYLGSSDKIVAMTQFVVAAYRAPEFGVEVVPAQPEVVQGAPIQATVAVSYFFGLPVQDAAVQWRVTATDYTPPQHNTSRFSYDVVDDMRMCWYCWWIPAPPPDVIATGKGRTDANGNLHITLPSLLKNSSGITITTSTRLEIEATVIGADNQAVSNRASIVRHASDVSVGIASHQSFGVVDKEQTIDVVALGINNVPIAKQDITIVVDKTQWEDIYIPQEQQWRWELTHTPVFTRVVTTDARGAASIHFTPTIGGNYLLIATTHDSANREVAASNDLWIASNEYVSWWHNDTDRITLLSDTTAYTVGDTASILIPSPFQQPHWALITVERGGILQHDVRRVQSNSIIYELPITSDYVPNIYVSVVLVAAPYTDAVYGVNIPAEYKVGILPLTIAPDPQTLTVSVKPESNQTRPGDTIRYDVHITNNAGTPVAAELSLDLVDKSVLTLKPRQAQAIRAAFYGMRGLGVVTASSLAISAERLLHEEPSDDDKDRDGDGDLDVDVEVPLTPTVLPMPTNEPPQNNPGGSDDAVAEESSPGVSVRQEFQDTAYWQAHVETDDDGAVSVNVPLPDNITTWVMRAIAVTKDTKVGEATTDIVTSKPLLIRPVTPRFFVVGDKATVAANISNGTDAPLTTHVWLTTSGVTVTSALTQTLVVPAGGEAKARWDVVVGDVAAVDMTFFAAAGEYRDASKPRLTTAPNNMLAVYRYIAPETVGTAGMLATGESRTEVIALPPRLDNSKGNLTVKLSPSLAASMQESLRYLEHYEYECTEQVVSRFLPNILTLQAIKRLGIARPDVETHLQSLVQHGMDKLMVRQNSDGGWGWWYGRSQPFISGYVMFGLWQAQQAGFVVNEDMMERGTEYLAMVVSGNFDISYDDYDRTSINQRAWLLYVCTLLLDDVGGASDDAIMMSFVTDTLYHDRHQMQLFAQAFLALSMHQQNPQDERIATLLADIQSDAIVSATGVHWEEQYHDWWSMNTDTRTTAIILSMMAQLDPTNALNPNVVRWLMVAREGDAWQTTQETAWALISLTNWMVVTGELNADYDYAVWLYEPQASHQDTPPPLLSGHISSSDVLTSVVLQRDVATLLANTSNWLTIGRSSGAGMLYYTAHLNAYMPVEYISALSRGMQVQRRYTLASCTEGAACPTIDTVKVGDVVRVEVSLMAPNQLYYVLLEDPIPAGTEIVDTTLATTAHGNDDEDSYPSSSSWYAWWWHWQWYTHKEFRDEKVVLFAHTLSRGTYTYSYNVQATTPGEFRVIPTIANEMYFPEVQARGDGQLFNVVE